MVNSNADKPQIPLPKLESMRKGISLIWFVPLIALVLGGWLVYKNWASRGPLVTISFDNAAGIEAGTTLIKYRDVSIGKVEAVEIGADFDHVLVTARLISKMASYLNESTQFWIERPRVGTTGISGLGTLFSGAHIGFEATVGVRSGSRQEFVGLESPPLVNTGSDGVRITLRANSIRSLNPGSPVYYKSLRVGTVESVAFDDNFEGVVIKLFVLAPYSTLVHAGSRFWNVSGVSANVGSEGIAVDIESIESLLVGGVAFDSPENGNLDDRPVKDVVFQLYPSVQAVDVKSYSLKLPYMLNFDQSLRGLNVDAQVEYRGIKIGRVADIRSDYKTATNQILLPVLIEIEPERLGINTKSRTEKALYTQIKKLGLVARLEIANLLTGQLFVSLNSESEAFSQNLPPYDGVEQLPTNSTDLTKIVENVDAALTKINQLEIESLLANLNDTIGSISGTLENVNNFVNQTSISTNTALSSLDDTLKSSVKLLESGVVMFDKGQAVMESLDEGSATRYELDKTLQDLQAASRSLKTLLETIEKSPNSIIFGKQNRN